MRRQQHPHGRDGMRQRARHRSTDCLRHVRHAPRRHLPAWRQAEQNVKDQVHQ